MKVSIFFLFFTFCFVFLKKFEQRTKEERKMQVRTEFGRRRTKEQRKALENGEEMRIKLPPAYEKVWELVKLATRIGPIITTSLSKH